ncbi:hypothetical protein CTI12_AA502710 [Artemisia annua]|uniref:Uncharacterized protein n=1 Tax=Artemisia annua TaxID=35608 RepID=A0A2U1LDK1_ARTAN|nr:hypothetical protein CTI12_AA502710 [Artemisia annua]
MFSTPNFDELKKGQSFSHFDIHQEWMGWNVWAERKQRMGDFCKREERAYMDAESSYNEMLEEVEARREYRHGLIVELMKIERDCVLDECLVILRAAEQEDFAEISRLIMMSHSAALRAGEKGRVARKLRKLA